MSKKNFANVNGFSQLFIQEEKSGTYGPVIALAHAQDYDELYIVSGSAESTIANIEYFSYFGLRIPQAPNGTFKIAFKVSEERTGQFQPLYNTSGTLVEVTATTGSYNLPSELAPWDFMMLWLENSGSDTKQSAVRQFTLVKKG